MRVTERWRQDGRRRGGETQIIILKGIGIRLMMTLMIILMTVVMALATNDPWEDEDDLALSLGLLYRDTKNDLNPHDMLARPGERKLHPPSPPITPDTEETQQKKAVSPGCEGGKEEEEEVRHELSHCQARLDALQSSLEEEQIASLKFQKMLAKEGILDLQAFYRRATQHLWNTLKLQEARDILKEGNRALVRQVTVRVTVDDLEGLENYLKTETHPHKVDEFLEHGFTLEPESTSSTSLLHLAFTLTHTVIQTAKSIEVWLCVLCAGFVLLAAWAVVLFVQDIRRELRWGSVLGMMGTVVFFICCLWHWRHLYKMAESRRHAQLAKRGYAGIPDECKPGAASSAGTVYDWVKVNLFGGPDVCEKYFEELMIDAIEEITPGMVIAETVSKFLFQPLQHLGTESGKLTTNFFKNVPPAYHIPATVLFLVLFIVVLFYGCAYGIDFPLGLGGFRPMARQGSVAAGDGRGLGSEAVEQLKKDREKFLEESRRMLNDISKAVQGSQVGHQPVVLSSSSILEVELEHLITRRLDRVMEDGGAAGPGVRTITSTPLRSEGHVSPLHPSMDHCRANNTSQSLLGDLSSSSEGSGHGAVVFGEHGDPTALLVATDAVHRRMKTSQPVKVLPPRTTSTSRSCSNTSSNTSSAASSEVSSPTARRHKGSKFMRLFRSADNPASPPPSPSASTHSLGQTGLDVPHLDATPDQDSFLEEVRNVLDLSANSGPSTPDSTWITNNTQT